MLIKNIDFKFIVNLLIVQRILAYTSGVTTALQKRGIDLVNVCNQIQILIRTLESTRQRADKLHKECFEDVDIKKYPLAQAPLFLDLDFAMLEVLIVILKEIKKV